MLHGMLKQLVEKEHSTLTNETQEPTSKAELDGIAKDKATELKQAERAFNDLRKAGSAADLVAASTAVVKATRSAEASRKEADTFELVAVYTSLRELVMAGIVGSVDNAMLAKHDITSVTITIPVSTDEAVTIEKVTVNTLGKRTVVKSSGGNGTRTRYVYGPGKLNSRQLVEEHGADEVGQERAEATLADPSKYGLTHLADRIAKKLDFDKVPA